MKKSKVIYFKKNRNPLLKGKKIAVLGYGSQGRAQALNLRDSGNDVVIGNIKDKFSIKAKKDGFLVLNFKKAVIAADIIFLLLPDQVHKQVYEKYIKNFIKEECMIVVAHGYSIYFKDLVVDKKHDVCLLAPRMPGAPIREQYLNGHGSPAFYAVVNNSSGSALEKLLKLADDLGYTKAGIVETTLSEETEIDLFIEQYFLPNLIGSIDRSFEFLVSQGFNYEIALTELYASGEVGELLLRASNKGVHKVWEENASPTCRFGVMSNIDRVIPKKNSNKLMLETLKNIRSGYFKRSLDIEASNNYRKLKKFDKENNKNLMYKTQLNLNKIFKNAKNKK